MRLVVSLHGKTIELMSVPTLDELEAELRGFSSAIESEPERF